MKNQPINQMFKAFADETRLRILSLLSRGELCVCDIMNVIKEPQSKVSRHLAYLRKSGLVQTRRDGLWIYYSLTQGEGRFHRQLLKCLSECFTEAPVLKQDRKNLLKEDRKAACC